MNRNEPVNSINNPGNTSTEPTLFQIRPVTPVHYKKGLQTIRPRVDPPRVDPPHVRPKRGRSASTSGTIRP